LARGVSRDRGLGGICLHLISPVQGVSSLGVYEGFRLSVGTCYGTALEGGGTLAGVEEGGGVVGRMEGGVGEGPLLVLVKSVPLTLRLCLVARAGKRIR
jgi:hypothetical protein